jgi:rsbT co-antagonist protein RsbR
MREGDERGAEQQMEASAEIGGLQAETLAVLREQNARLRLLAEVAPVGMYHTDGQGCCLYVNRRWCEIAGLTVEEALGDGWNRAIHVEDRPRVFAEWIRAATENLPFKLEFRFCRPDGHVTWVLSQAAAERGPDGAVKAYVGSVTEITDRREMEATIRALNEDLERRIAELSTPLIPLAENVIAMPIVGTIDQVRSQQVVETLLAGIGYHQAQVAILDLTGVRTVDALVADTLLQAARAARLLGTEVVLTGLRPDVARTLVGLGTNLEGIVVRNNLKSGILHAFLQVEARSDISARSTREDGKLQPSTRRRL